MNIMNFLKLIMMKLKKKKNNLSYFFKIYNENKN